MAGPDRRPRRRCLAVDIPWTDYFDAADSGPRQVRFKFVREGAWMLGPNLTIGPDGPWTGGVYAVVGAGYDFDDTTVNF
jgi:hypothetical protein